MTILPYATRLSRTGVVTADPENKCSTWFLVFGKSPYEGMSFWAGGFRPPYIRSFWAVLGIPLLGEEKKKGRG